MRNLNSVTGLVSSRKAIRSMSKIMKYLWDSTSDTGTMSSLGWHRPNFGSRPILSDKLSTCTLYYAYGKNQVININEYEAI